MKYYSHIKNLLGIETNTEEFTWIYGKASPEVTKTEYEKCLIRLSVHITDDKSVFSEKELEECDGNFQHFHVNSKEKKLFYDRGFLFGKKLRYTVSVDGNRVVATVGKSYFKLIKIRFMNIHSIQYILTDTVSGILLKNGYASLYCSACYFPSLEKSAVMFSAPGVGKTTVCMQLCEKYGGTFISEDVALTDGENIFSVPWTNSARNGNKGKSGISDSRQNSFDGVKKMLDSGKICDRAAVSDIFVLERGKESVSADKEAVYNKVSLLDRYLFHYRCSPAVTVMNYFIPEFSVSEMEEKEKAIHKKLIEGAECRTVTKPDGESFDGVLYGILEAAGSTAE